MSSLPNHVDVAAYVLGILDEDEVDAFENHLAQCRRCALDLRDFAQLPDLLDEANAAGLLSSDADERPDGRSVRSMLDVVSLDRARKRRKYSLYAAAAALVLIALSSAATYGVVSSGGLVAQDDGSPRQTEVARNSVDASGELVRTNAETGVWARISASPEPWGTSLEFEVKGVRAKTGELVAKSRDGKTYPVATWLVTADDAEGARTGEAVTIPGGLALRWHEITEFAVRDKDSGEVLLLLPTSD
ncbi:anti-sigma factor family protein [Actinosynnema mirum]|uniref:Putative transmembrane anti-sigma factor n=1 Tax=Actinosynnema mirum (strain ATCC 29888 / DSM 43827 / JCM 3225 / NBRC 14064 / NCIMB 13271 / NRRL B-12336 / IMRU 3971 / 101) TaxID=446462 RepID=C6WS26_ACTMD|nr:zf-HC2 domain-containing protein [Actinosynnema mirum]ACU38846.1 putative transmembrane anti-sigma factor [Actinosynnema mirum DSM 43827]